MKKPSGMGMAMAPKRVGPPQVPPVQVDGLEIRALHWARDDGFDQNGGYIEAWPANATEAAWRLRVYETIYDPKMEIDVQDCFINAIALVDGGMLLVTDERARRYMVNLETRHVQAL